MEGGNKASLQHRCATAWLPIEETQKKLTARLKTSRAMNLREKIIYKLDTFERLVHRLVVSQNQTFKEHNSYRAQISHQRSIPHYLPKGSQPPSEWYATLAQCLVIIDYDWPELDRFMFVQRKQRPLSTLTPSWSWICPS